MEEIGVFNRNLIKVCKSLQEVVQSARITSNKTDVTSSNLLHSLVWTCQKKKKKKKKKKKYVKESIGSGRKIN
jgi:hypothetical protein